MQGHIVVPGTILLGKYRVEGTIGEGGMATVLEATHMSLKQRVAIKLLMGDLAQNPTNVLRFTREAQAAAKITSDHVVRVTDVGTMADGVPYMVMERLHGMDLAQRLSRHGPLSVSDAADLVIQASDALHEAHELDIVHRDLKPANVFLAHRDGELTAKVLDFGISKFLSTAAATTPGITRDHSVMGTLCYMSPEQIRSTTNTDRRTDIWAMGCIVYEMISGRRAFPAADNWADTIPRIMLEQPPRLHAPPPIVELVDRCLRKSATERYANLVEVVAAIAPYATHRSRRALERCFQRSGRALGSRPPVVDNVAGRAGAVPPTTVPHLPLTNADGGPLPAGRLASSSASGRSSGTELNPMLNRFGPHPLAAPSPSTTAAGATLPSRPTKPSWLPFALGAGLVLVVGLIGYAIGGGEDESAAAVITFDDEASGSAGEASKDDDPVSNVDRTACGLGDLDTCGSLCERGDSESCARREMLVSQQRCTKSQSRADCAAFVRDHCDATSNEPASCPNARELAVPKPAARSVPPPRSAPVPRPAPRPVPRRTPPPRRRTQRPPPPPPPTPRLPRRLPE